jgi:septal ring factor EnvC (AmiA/AmiB activator)
MRRAVRLILPVVALLLCGAAYAHAQSEGTLRGRIGGAKAREGSLAAAIARLSKLEAATQRDITVLEGRVADVQAQLGAAEARARASALALQDAQARVIRLEKRLAQVRAKLSALLLSRYKNGEPDLLGVVLDARGFQDLLETVTYVHRVQQADTRLLDVVRSAKADARRERARLTVLTRRREAAAAAVRARKDALAGVLAGLQSRRDALARARAAHQAALSRTRAGRRAAERSLSKLLAERARAAASSAGPGGPWAIPWAIVQCESGGQNLSPNSAGASGYYQMLPSTWRGLGGSTPQAFQASKGEQDRLAARLWAGGSGAHNWVCASLVGAV